MIEQYDITFIGAGPSTIFAVLKLIEANYNGKILIIEKGKSLKTREKYELINGWCGAGAFSDSKLSSALDVGGIIPGLTQKELIEYENEILATLNKFKTDSPLIWDNIEDYNTKDTGLKWNTHHTCHVGTDNGQLIYSKIEEFVTSQPNITILFETELEKAYDLSNGIYQLIFKKSNTLESAFSVKLVAATGQKSTLTSDLIEAFKLSVTSRPFQIGIRVEDKMNEDYEKIIKANYDFKFVKDYFIGNNVHIRVRTFCCNSGNARTCAERTSEGYVCFNGHAFKTPDPKNKSVNYGIMCEVEGLNEFNSKEDQIKLMHQINNIKTWYADNFSADNLKPKRSLLNLFPQLKNNYPKEVIYALEDFVYDLSKLINLSHAHYLYPEVKLSGYIPKLNYKSFETERKNFYMIGDCACSRGIVKAAITGIIMAKSIIGGNEDVNNN